MLVWYLSLFPASVCFSYWQGGSSNHCLHSSNTSRHERRKLDFLTHSKQSNMMHSSSLSSHLILEHIWQKERTVTHFIMLHAFSRIYIGFGLEDINLSRISGIKVELTFSYICSFKLQIRKVSADTSLFTASPRT